MRLRNADPENIEAKRPRNWKRRAGVVALSAALLGGLPAASTATAAGDAHTDGTRVTAASADAGAATLRYIDHYFWKSDCEATGSNGIRSGSWTYWECVNGSGSPFDDYELWVSG